MKRALIFSDSHSYFDYMESVIRKEKENGFEAIFHMGDIQQMEERLRRMTPYPVHIVKGNCDFGSNLPEELTVTFAGKRIAMCHGHRYLSIFGGGMDALRYFGKERDAQYVFFGHTHVPFLEQASDITLLNPGSISQPRQEKKIPTYAVMEVHDDGEVVFHMCEYHED